MYRRPVFLDEIGYDEYMIQVLAHLFTPRHTNNHRPAIIHPEGLFVLTTLVLVFHVGLKLTLRTFPQALGNVLGYASSITTTQVLESINQERQKGGLPPLKQNQQLAQAAAGKAGDMFNNQYWAHTSPSGTLPWAFIQNAGYKYKVAGENLARDFNNTSSMVGAWMASPSHKANIMQKQYTETGIAVVDGKLQGVETTLVVQMFAAPRAQAAQIPKKSVTTASTAQLKATSQPQSQPQTQVPEVRTAEVLAESTKAPQAAAPSSIFSAPIFSPLQISKSIFLAMILLLSGVLIYDFMIAQHRHVVRVVGKNFAHLGLFAAVGIMVIAFKGGSLL